MISSENINFKGLGETLRGFVRVFVNPCYLPIDRCVVACLLRNFILTKNIELYILFCLT